MPTLQQMLEMSRNIDVQIGSVQQRKTMAAVEALSKTNFGPGLPGAMPNEIAIADSDEDPFGGNVNNRKVAERIAGQTKRKYTNIAHPIHTGDPDKARKDIARSKSLLPDPAEEKDEDVAPAKLPTPTAGSPAAKRAAEAAAKPPVIEPLAAAPATSTAPPTWKPNA